MSRRSKSKEYGYLKIEEITQISTFLIITSLRFLQTFENVLVFSYQSMTTNSLRYLQNQLVDCKFCLGKKKVMKVTSLIRKSYKNSQIAKSSPLGSLLTSSLIQLFPYVLFSSLLDLMKILNHSQMLIWLEGSWKARWD